MNINRRGLSFIAVMVILALLALVLRFAIKRIMKITIEQNDANAQATLKLISASLESYAKDHNGIFPDNLSALIQNNPAYLDKDYIARSPVRGYEYDCSRLDASGYSCSAVPARCKLTGSIVYTVATAGPVVSQACAKQE